MEWNAWLSVIATLFALGMLMYSRVGYDLIFCASLTLLMLPIGSNFEPVLSVKEALAGFSNPGVLTVGILFIVVAGLRETGGLSSIIGRMLGAPQSLGTAIPRMMGLTIVSSAVLNNTPLVAIMIPIVKDWSTKFRISASKLMIPLSYSAMLGGMCTLIGTSTNLVVHGLMEKQTPELYPMGFFEIAWVGLPCAVVGFIYLAVTARWLLPDRKPAMAALEDPREYTIEMIVEPASPLAGRTIEEAGLRHLSGVYLVEIERGENLIQAVGPQQRLEANDRLIFVGIVESVKDLKRIRGLTPATDQIFKLDAPRRDRCMVEAVVSNSCPLVGRTIREGRFRNTYDAAVIAVGRSGERVKGKIGDIKLRTGDTLLLEAHPSFVDRQSNNRDFFLVSQVADSAPVRHENAWLSVTILIAMVVAMGTMVVDVLIATMVAAGLMIVTRCCPGRVARQSVDFSLLVMIGASLGVAESLRKTGAADTIAHAMLSGARSIGSLLPDGPSTDAWVALVGIYIVTSIFTEILANNAAAALIFPIAISTADQLDANPIPFIITIMVAASASFATPIGYQTNMMVMGPGGYRFLDYTRIGLPLNVLMCVVTVIVAPIIWPLVVK